MTAKSKSTELGVKTVARTSIHGLWNPGIHARLNTAINAEDAEAGDVHYHTSCYTKARMMPMLREVIRLDAAMMLLVISQLVAFVEYNHSTFKLADLRKLYDRRLNQLVSDWIGVYVHQKRFKEHILEKLGPDCQNTQRVVMFTSLIRK